MLITPEDLAAIVADVGLDALMDESIEEFENALHDGDLDVRRRDGFATGRDGATSNEVPAVQHRAIKQSREA